MIPIYYSEKTLYSLGSILIKELGTRYDLQIVMVNDGSTDQSHSEGIRFANDYPTQVQFITLSKNVGQDGATMAGLNYATGDYVVVMDDDFQHHISEIHSLVNKIQTDKNDVVFVKFKNNSHAFHRRLGSKFNDIIATILLKKPRDLYLSTFKIMKRRLVKELCKNKSPYVYVDGLVCRLTSNTGVIDIPHGERKEGQSGYTLIKLIGVWLNMSTGFSILPLRIATVSGVFVSSFSLLYGIYTVISKFLDPDYPEGWATLIVLITLFSGVQLLFLGIVGEYIGRLFMFQNGKPQYTVSYDSCELHHGDY